MPQVDYTQNVSEGTPELVDGVWTRVWEIADATSEQIAERTQIKAAEVRAERNRILAETDATILKTLETGAPLPPEVGLYRQALRDLPQQDGFPWGIVWPEAPAVTTGPDWYGFYQGLLMQPAFGHVRIVAATSVEVAVAYADCAIALSQAAIQRVNVPAIQASLDNLLGLMAGDNALSQTEQDGLVELLASCSLEDTITLTFAA
jgi:hypothetical protein